MFAVTATKKKARVALAILASLGLIFCRQASAWLIYRTASQWLRSLDGRSLRRDYQHAPISIGIPTTQSIYVTFFPHLRRRRRQGQAERKLPVEGDDRTFEAY
jgi:hypothetical protein